MRLGLSAASLLLMVDRRVPHALEHRPATRPAYRSPTAVVAAGDRELAAWRARRPKRRSSALLDREALVRAAIKRRLRGERYARIVAAGGAVAL